MTADEIRAAYAALLPPPEYPGDRVWMDRVATIEDFMDAGPFQAAAFRRDRADFGPQFVAQFRSMDPARFDLLMRAFPAAQGHP